MLDTVILKIPYKDIQITDYKRFGVFRDELERTSGFKKYENNPTKEEKESNYFPRLTLIKRPSKTNSGVYLKIEFSCPKMIYKNNVDEIREEDLDLIIDNLKNRLLKMGVIIQENIIKYAEVTTFHVSKNIILDDGYTANFVIGELQKIDIPSYSDIERSSFKNGGESLQIYTNSHSMTIYNKKADLIKNKGRAIDKDSSENQQYSELLKGIELLRLEVRICKKRKIKELSKEIGFRNPQHFKDLFDLNISREILLFYWRKIVPERNLFTFDIVESSQKILKNILEKTRFGMKQSIYFTGLLLLSKDTGGIRAFKNICLERATNKTWYRIHKDLAKIPTTIPHSWIGQITRQLNEFKPFNLSTFDVKKSKV